MICLLAGAGVIALGVSEITLEWQHSVEKQLWQEDWRAQNGALYLLRARVTGSGAGMEAGEGAHKNGVFWEWVPKIAPLTALTLRRSQAVADYRICFDGQCRSLQIVLAASGQARAHSGRANPPLTNQAALLDPVQLVPCKGVAYPAR